MKCKRVVATAALAFATSALAQRYEQDPFAHLEAALAVAARDPAGALHLRHALDSRRELGLTADTTFVLVNATTDDGGSSHARLQQFFRGVKVQGAELISHQDASGAFQPYTDGAERTISISVTPVLSEAQALDIVARLDGRQAEYSWTPRTELVIEPIYERVLVSTGRPPPAPTFDRTNPSSPVDATNAADVVRRVTGHRLLWNIRTLEGREGANESINEMAYSVDANGGQVVHQKSLSRFGTGKSLNNGTVALQTSIGLGGFAMMDFTRNYRTTDDASGVSSFANVDSDDNWGDGLPFTGTLSANASVINRQTAMVDGHFGASVYWDMVSKVYKRNGPDGKFHDVNIHAHVGSAMSPFTVLNNAFYSPATGNISLGDGANMQQLDVVAHESGHGLNDFTAGLKGDMGDGINESHADIMGVLATFYRGGGGFAAGSTKIPASAGVAFPTPFTGKGSGRNMMKPTKGAGTNRSDFWFSGIENLPDEHDIGLPNDRAFFFLAQGASPFMKSDAYSPLLPWGMTGVGNDLAGHIWVTTMTAPFIVSNPDYVDVRAAASLGAQTNLGANPLAVAAVANAYAGIAVGNKAGGYPADVSPSVAANNNLTPATCQIITLPKIPLGATVPGKLKFFAVGPSSRFYCFSLPPGASLTARVNPMFATSDWDLFLSDDFGTPLQKAILGKGLFDLIDQKSGAGIAGQGESYVLEVRPFSLPNGIGMFTLDLDRY